MHGTRYDSYRPSEQEPYMNPRQLHYFRELLLKWRRQAARAGNLESSRLREEVERSADPIDQGVIEADRHFDYQCRTRTRRLLGQIDAALERIEEGTYGFCEESDEEIGLKRLMVLPFASLSLESQERREQVDHFRRRNQLA